MNFILQGSLPEDKPFPLPPSKAPELNIDFIKENKIKTDQNHTTFLPFPLSQPKLIKEINSFYRQYYVPYLLNSTSIKYPHKITIKHLKKLKKRALEKKEKEISNIDASNQNQQDTDEKAQQEPETTFETEEDEMEEFFDKHNFSKESLIQNAKAICAISPYSIDISDSPFSNDAAIFPRTDISFLIQPRKKMFKVPKRASSPTITDSSIYKTIKCNNQKIRNFSSFFEKYGQKEKIRTRKELQEKLRSVQGQKAEKDKKEYDELQNKFNELYGLCQKEEKQFDSLQDLLEKQKNQFYHHSYDLSQIKRQNYLSKQELNSIQKEIQSTELSIQSFLNEIDLLTKKHQKRQIQLEIENKKLQKVNTKINQTKIQITEEDINSKTKQIEDLSQEIDQQETELKDIQTQWFLQNNILMSLTKELQQEKEKQIKYQRKEDSLTSKINILKSSKK